MKLGSYIEKKCSKLETKTLVRGWDAYLSSESVSVVLRRSNRNDYVVVISFSKNDKGNNVVDISPCGNKKLTKTMIKKLRPLVDEIIEFIEKAISHG